MAIHTFAGEPFSRYESEFTFLKCMRCASMHCRFPVYDIRAKYCSIYNYVISNLFSFCDRFLSIFLSCEEKIHH